MATETLANAVASRSLPPAQPIDGQPVRSRSSPYGDAVVQFISERQAADEGSLFVATNPTPSTGIQVNAIAGGQAYDATRGILAIFNGNKTRGRNIYPVALALHVVTGAPTGTLVMNFAHKVQTSTRDPVTDDTVITPVAVNGARSERSAAAVHFPLTNLLTFTTDGADMRLVGRSRIQTGVCVVGDSYVLHYGAPDPEKAGFTAARATDPARLVAGAPAVCIAPGEWYVSNFWWTTQAVVAFTVEFELKYIER